jgi:hypothetical protein
MSIEDGDEAQNNLQQIDPLWVESGIQTSRFLSPWKGVKVMMSLYVLLFIFADTSQ